VLRTRAPCAIPYCYGTRTRLACVKHAASVRSEPGSNSRLKPVAWTRLQRAKMNCPPAGVKKPRFAPRPACPSKLLIARFTQSIQSRKTEWLRTDSGTSYRLSKSEAPLSSRKAIHNHVSMPAVPANVNRGFQISTSVHRENFAPWCVRNRAYELAPGAGGPGASGAGPGIALGKWHSPADFRWTRPLRRL
jgi:hypothetical protein